MLSELNLPFEEFKFEVNNEGFERRDIDNQAKRLLKDLKCDDCNSEAQYANFLDEDSLKLICDKCKPEGEEFNNFEELERGLHKRLTKLEKSLVFTEAMFTFSQFKKFREHGTVEDQNEIDTSYWGSKKLIQELVNQLRQSSEKGDKNSLELIKNYNLSMDHHVENLHRRMGHCMARFFSHDLLDKISADIEEAKGEEEDPEGIKFNKEFIFLNMFNQDKKEMEKMIKNMSEGAGVGSPTSPNKGSDAKLVQRLQEELDEYKEKYRDMEKKYQKEKERVSKLKSNKKVPKIDEHHDMDHIYPFVEQLKNKPEDALFSIDTCLAINAKHSGDKKFIEETMNMSFPQIQSLALTSMEKFKHHDDIHMANKFLANAINKPLGYLHLSCEKNVEMAKFNIGVRAITNLVSHQVYFKHFNIDGLNLKEILESSSQVNHVVFYDCKIDDLEGFELDDTIDYSIKVLDLYETANIKEESKLNNKKIIAFAEALGKTSLKDCIERIHVKNSEYPIKDLEYVFQRFGFKTSICGDEKWPYSKDHDHKTMDLYPH